MHLAWPGRLATKMGCTRVLKNSKSSDVEEVGAAAGCWPPSPASGHESQNESDIHGTSHEIKVRQRRRLYATASKGRLTTDSRLRARRAGRVQTGYAKAGVFVQDVFVVPEARQGGVGRALMAAVAADARRRGLEFVWWASRTWNTESHAFFRTPATVEEPVIAFATFGDQFTKLADEGD